MGIHVTKEAKNTRRIPFTCTFDCAARCELIACVQDGQLVRIDTPPERPGTDAPPRLVPCIRGRAQGRLAESRDRVLTPLRRIGPRGTDQFEPVSWDEALDEVADRLACTRSQHGAEAILHLTGAGSIGGRGISGGAASNRFFSHWAAVTGTSGNMSSWCTGIANQWMFGGTSLDVPTSTLTQSRLILLWGMNPAENRHGPMLAPSIAQARDNGARVILIDPRYTDSSVFANHWVPIRPGTDVALVAAIAHTWESDGLVDTEFMRTHTVGYEEYRRYVLGEEDGVAKDLEWGSQITGIPVDTIRELAREYGSTKPALLLAGLGPQRSLYGEQTARALMTLVCMSGNMGIPGGGFSHNGRHSSGGAAIAGLPYGPFRAARTVRQENWAKFLLNGSLEPSIRMAYIVAANAINRSSDTRANARALEQLDYVVVQDPFFTPTARLADMVFPICTDLEHPDLIRGQGETFYNPQILPPAGESQTDYWVLARLAERLGFGEAYTSGRTEEEWIQHLLALAGIDGESLKRDGLLRSQEKPTVPLSGFRADPTQHCLETASGLIQIVCHQAEGHGLPRLPSYLDSRPGSTTDYPLQLVTPHSKLRANSTGHPNDWLQRLEPHRVWIHPLDAAARGIKNGDAIEVFNAYGTVVIPAKFTERIMPGVVCIYQGTWYQPGPDGRDTGGCANTLTSHNVSPTGGMAVHSEWVNVRRSQS